MRQDASQQTTVVNIEHHIASECIRASAGMIWLSDKAKYILSPNKDMQSKILSSHIYLVSNIHRASPDTK
jgi:hypothetical protein